ncbi:MAG: hypothetical protein H6839_14040 [Planctomycetes bacterium]|nr:hypothetical protein [Planctomycetota bacterium]
MRAILLLLMLGLATFAGAEEFTHADFHFTVPAGFSTSPVPKDTRMICAYRRPAQGATSEAWLFIEPFPGLVPDRMEDPSKIFVMEPGFQVNNRWITDWNGTRIGIAEGQMKSTSGVNRHGQQTATYDYLALAFLPAHPQALRVSVLGNPAEAPQLKELLLSTLGTLHPTAPAPGSAATPSNAPEEGADNATIIVLILVVAGLLFAGGAAFIILRKRTANAAPVAYNPMTSSAAPSQSSDRAPTDRAPWE